MPKSLTKVQKHISKKKGGKLSSLHENSRDSQRLQRASARDDKIARLSSWRSKQNRPLLQRITHFKDPVIDKPGPFSVAEMQSFIEEYLSRNDEELAKLKGERRAGRPPSTREIALKQLQSTEAMEYETGFWLPNLEEPENIDRLRRWDGSWVKLNSVNFIRILKDGTSRASTFPPRGLS